MAARFGWVLAIVAGMWGMWANLPINAEDSSRPTTQQSAADRQAKEDEYLELFRSFVDTLDQIERNYVTEIDRQKLLTAAINGMIQELDPYSSYIEPEEINQFRTSVESRFGGIGIQIGMNQRGEIEIISPLVGSPAYRNGLHAGDVIVKINDESTEGFTLDDAVNRLKGEAGSSVRLTIRQVYLNKERTVSLTREVVKIQTVMGDKRNADDSWDFMYDDENKIGYIRISAFSRETTKEFRKAIEQLRDEGMKGLIVDLRFNPGGLLSVAIDICDMFVADGRIVSTKGRNTQERVWEAHNRGTLDDFPMVILVNGFSASASEIVSACLQDHNRAVIVGERTWGKGSVQNVIDLEGGSSALKLTTATYWRPSGKNIHRLPDASESDEWGVKPNEGFRVVYSNRELFRFREDRRKRDRVVWKPDSLEEEESEDEETDEEEEAFVDRQLRKGYDYILKELKGEDAEEESDTDQSESNEKVLETSAS
ncbi:Carboxy-terminal processing protease CtpA [Planctomycetales bacterium 10988]|nr:Carboxy-terminal processing protease CtpA [Planctomycetales bacterium 10988]